MERQLSRHQTAHSSEGQFLDEEVHVRVHFKPMQVVGVALDTHKQSAERHVGSPENENACWLVRTSSSRSEVRTVDQ